MQNTSSKFMKHQIASFIVERKYQFVIAQDLKGKFSSIKNHNPKLTFNYLIEDNT